MPARRWAGGMQKEKTRQHFYQVRIQSSGWKERHARPLPSPTGGSTSDATALTWNSSGFPLNTRPGNHQGASGRKPNKKAASGPRDSKRRKGKCNSAYSTLPAPESLWHEPPYGRYLWKEVRAMSAPPRPIPLPYYIEELQTHCHHFGNQRSREEKIISPTDKQLRYLGVALSFHFLYFKKNIDLFLCCARS